MTNNGEKEGINLMLWDFWMLLFTKLTTVITFAWYFKY